MEGTRCVRKVVESEHTQEIMNMRKFLGYLLTNLF